MKQTITSNQKNENCISLIIANDMDQGNEVTAATGLEFTQSAVLTKPEYLDGVNLINNETIYVHGQASTEMIRALTDKIHSSAKTVNVQFINL
jgi:hypothetical protein